MNNRIRNISLLIVLGIFISLRLHVACTGLQSNKQTDDPVTNIAIPAQYYGAILTDTGEDSLVVLHLDEDMFTEIRRERDPFGSAVIVEGEWMTRADTLYLTAKEGESCLALRIEGDRLVGLEPGSADPGKEEQGSYELSRSQEFDSVSQHFRRLESDGVRFFSSGNEPFWSFRITGEDDGSFSTPEQTTETRVVLDEQQESAGKTIHFYISEEIDFGVRIENEPCQDSMSGVLFTHTVSIHYNSMPFTGCGTYL